MRIRLGWPRRPTLRGHAVVAESLITPVPSDLEAERVAEDRRARQPRLPPVRTLSAVPELAIVVSWIATPPSRPRRARRRSRRAAVADVDAVDETSTARSARRRCPSGGGRSESSIRTDPRLSDAHAAGARVGHGSDGGVGAVDVAARAGDVVVDAGVDDDAVGAGRTPPSRRASIEIAWRS